MFKKNLYIIFFIFFALILSACSTGNKEVVNDQTNKVTKECWQAVQEPTSKSSTNTKNNTGDTNGKCYETTIASYTDKGVKINYPQVAKLGDSNKQEVVNEIIKGEALKVLNFYSGDGSELTLEIGFDIKWKSERLLSIQYSGVGYVKGAAHPNNLFYTTNINIVNGSTLRLKDLVNINEAFADKFNSGQFIALKSYQKNLPDMLTNEDLLKEFRKADSLDNRGTENQSNTFSYLTKDALGISMSVSHAAGDHVEFEIKYQDIANNIKAENEVWKDIPSINSDKNFNNI